MLDFVKKVMLTGVGMAALTKEKVEELAKDFAEKSDLSEKEGKQFVDDLLKKSEQARMDLQEKIEKAAGNAIKKMNCATADDISELRDEINQLKQLLKEKDQ